jgi:hypothetical protein
MEEWTWVDSVTPRPLFRAMTGYEPRTAPENKIFDRNVRLGEPVELAKIDGDKRFSRDRLEVFRLPSDVKGVYHEFAFTSPDDPLYDVSWYVGLENCTLDEKLSISSPRNRPDFGDVNVAVFGWKSTAGDFFEVEILIKYPDGKWNIQERCFTKNNFWVHRFYSMNLHAWNKRMSKETEENKKDVISHAWRVRAVEKSGKIGKWTDFIDFKRR